MNDIFKLCVQLLVNLASKLGTTYEALNVWIFVIIEPVIFMFMGYIILSQKRTIQQFKKNRSIGVGIPSSGLPLSR